ncbi:MAG: DUF4870 domain-containing protein, partial [Desulfobacterales bacterium]|nr:DUF4870 domain-containing protein [Desulfobacterales bacterium]
LGDKFVGGILQSLSDGPRYAVKQPVGVRALGGIIKKDESPFVDDQGKESLNFQISISIYTIIAALLTLVVIGFVLVIALLTFDMVMVIIAAVKSNNGERYRYPLCMRFIK